MPSMKLTSKSVVRLPLSTDGYVEYYDPKLTGFGVRVGPKSKVYFVYARVGAKQIKQSIGKVGLLEFDDAYAEALRILRDAAKGTSPADRDMEKLQVAKERQAETNTVQQMFADFCSTRKELKQSTKDHYAKKLNCYLADWMDLPLLSITPQMVIAKHAEIGKKSHAQANHVFRVLRAVFNHAMAMHETLFASNPVDRLSRVSAWYKSTRRKTCLKRSELPVFLEALERSPGMVADYLLLLLLTGCRPNEISGLTISQVFPNDGIINLAETKTTDNLVLPLSDKALDVIRHRISEAEAADEKYLFWSHRRKAVHIDDVSVSIKTILKGTGISICRYDLRRTFLTCAEELCVSNVVQKRLVGHAVSQDVTDGYKVLTLERLRAETQRVTDFIMGRTSTVR